MVISISKIYEGGRYIGKKTMFFVTSLTLLVGLLYGSEVLAQQEKPKIAPICKQCHQPDEKILRGTLGGISGKTEIIQVQIGPEPWLVKFDEDTKLIGAEAFGKIPKDKEIIAHCATGVRAEMVYHILKEAGYKARFLNANIKIDKDGKYEISKE